MSYLVPEVHVNKNGVSVTKHVRPNRQRAVSMAGVPAPNTAFDPVAASAILLVLTTRAPTPGEDRRVTLIRDMVNAGMDDDDAVNFLALPYMPVELLEKTARYIDLDTRKKWKAEHRQSFFRFANDAYFEMPADEASSAVANAIDFMPEGVRFTDHVPERLSELKRFGIDFNSKLSGTDALAAQSMIAVLDVASKLPTRAVEDYLADSGELDRNGVPVHTYIKDPELADLVLRSGERYPQLVEIILDRKTLDPALLEMILDSPAPSIREGIL